jgi:hypothetical protein
LLRTRYAGSARTVGGQAAKPRAAKVNYLTSLQQRPEDACDNASTVATLAQGTNWADVFRGPCLLLSPRLKRRALPLSAKSVHPKSNPGTPRARIENHATKQPVGGRPWVPPSVLLGWAHCHGAAPGIEPGSFASRARVVPLDQGLDRLLFRAGRSGLRCLIWSCSPWLAGSSCVSAPTRVCRDRLSRVLRSRLGDVVLPGKEPFNWSADTATASPPIRQLPRPQLAHV